MLNFEEYAKSGNNNDYIMQQFKKLKEKLEKFTSSEGKKAKIFLQGSYKNDTNINEESDIDIVVYYPHVFYSNIQDRRDDKKFNVKTFITEANVKKYKTLFPPSKYTFEKFKNELKTYLNVENIYFITIGNKTIKCKIPNSNFTFDIVCTFQYRLYKTFSDEKSDYIKGNIIIDENGNKIINFPIQSFENSESKNKDFNNGGHYKETVRIFKTIMKKKISKEKWIPSFALECILYNIGDGYFNEPFKQKRCQKIVNSALYLVKNNWNTLLESNKLLFVQNIKGISQDKSNLLLNQIKTLINE